MSPGTRVSVCSWLPADDLRDPSAGVLGVVALLAQVRLPEPVDESLRKPRHERPAGLGGGTEDGLPNVGLHEILSHRAASPGDMRPRCGAGTPSSRSGVASGQACRSVRRGQEQVPARRMTRGAAEGPPPTDSPERARCRSRSRRWAVRPTETPTGGRFGRLPLRRRQASPDCPAPHLAQARCRCGCHRRTIRRSRPQAEFPDRFDGPSVPPPLCCSDSRTCGRSR